MNHKIYNVYDSKAETWGMPLFYDCRANALRSLQECVNSTDEKNQIAKYPGDFSFFEIGEYSQETGSIVMFDSKINLGLALEYKKSELVTTNN